MAYIFMAYIVMEVYTRVLPIEASIDLWVGAVI